MSTWKYIFFKEKDIKLKDSLELEVKACKNKRDFRKLLLKLQSQVSDNVSYSNSEIMVKKEYIYDILMYLKDYKNLESLIVYEDVSMNKYFKLHKTINFKFYLIFSILFIVFSVVSCLNGFINIHNLLFQNFLLLFMNVILIESSCVKVLDLFPQIFKNISNNNLLIDDIDYRMNFLIKMYKVKVYRELRNGNLFTEKRVNKILYMGAMVFSLYKILGDDIYMFVIVSALLILSYYSSMRYFIGTVPSRAICELNPKKISVNIYSADDHGGIWDINRTYYYVFFFFLFKSLYTINLIILFYVFKDQASLFIYAIIILFIYLYDIIKDIPIVLRNIISLHKNNKEKKNKLYEEILEKLKSTLFVYHI